MSYILEFLKYISSSEPIIRRVILTILVAGLAGITAVLINCGSIVIISKIRKLFHKKELFYGNNDVFAHGVFWNIEHNIVKGVKTASKYVKTKFKHYILPPDPPKIVKIDFWEGTPTWTRRNIISSKDGKTEKFIQAHDIDGNGKILKIYRNGVALYRWNKTKTTDSNVLRMSSELCLDKIKVMLIEKCEEKIYNCSIIKKDRNRIVFTFSEECLNKLVNTKKIMIKDSVFTTKKLSSGLCWLQI